jgi:nucleoside-diphosphate-sugar epimerase
MPMEDIIERYPEHFGSWPAGLKFVCEHMSIDISKAKKQLGYAPGVSLEVGMRLNLEWMRSEGMVSY